MTVEAVKLVSTQKKSKISNRLVASASIPSDVHHAMLKMAEMQGYETISAFVSDAIVEKCEMAARSILGAVQTKHTRFGQFDPQTDF